MLLCVSAGVYMWVSNPNRLIGLVGRVFAQETGVQSQVASYQRL